MKKVIEQLVLEHQRLTAITVELETLLPQMKNPMRPDTEGRLRNFARELVDLLLVHEQLEARELFPFLKERMPEENRWQLRMVEVQDELILAECRRFQELFAGPPSPPPSGKVREIGLQLVRWIREHIHMEETNFFSLVDDSPARS